MIETQLLHAHTLISLLHERPSAEALIEITGLAPKQRPIKRYFTDARIAAECGIELNAQRYSTFVSINPRRQMSGFESDVPYVTAFGLDLQPERTPIAEVEKRLALGGISPTVTGVSGHGFHFYLKLEQPCEPMKAKLVWERLCKYTGSDRVFNVNRIFRLPGTLNWKTDPRWCYLTGVYADSKYTLEFVDKALDRLGAAPVHPPKGEAVVSVDPPEDWIELRKRLSPGVLDIIATGEKNAFSARQITRSEADWVVVCGLIAAGATDEMVQWVFSSQPVGLLKFHEAGLHYLNQTIRSARRASTAPAVVDQFANRRYQAARPRGSSGERYRR